MKIPKRMPEQRKAILRILDGSPWTGSKEAIEQLPEHLKNHANKSLSWMYAEKWVTRKGTYSKFKYKLSAHGQAIFKEIDNIETGKSVGHKTRKKAAATVDAPPPQLNLSSTAEGMANGLALVMQENSNYRVLMLEMAIRIIKELDIKQEEIYGQGNSATS